MTEPDLIGRKCEACGIVHGPLYICDSYTAALKKEIQDESDRFVARLQDPEWVKAQMDRGVPEEAIAIFRDARLT